MSKLAFIGVWTPLFLLGAPAGAEWRSPILGAPPVLPSSFTPQNYKILEPLPPSEPGPVPAPAPPAVATVTPVAAKANASPPAPIAAASPATSAAWSLPLVDRAIGERERTADLSSDLQDAILRIEPMYDPTRLDGADAPPTMVVASGTASMDNVFADRWRVAADDPNVETKTAYLAMAWSPTSRQPCDAFFKNRVHAFGDPALTALDEDDCRALMGRQTRGFANPTLVPIVVARIEVPVFAAPLPGSRLSSEDFWAARRAHIASIQAHLRRKWQSDAARATRVGVR